MARVHVDGPSCTGCNAKLATAHPALAAWFRREKAINERLHVSCAYRGEAEQNEHFKAGKSQLRFPFSRHNAVDGSKPASRALDLFEMIDGKAAWNPQTFARINAANEANNLRIRWGGKFKTLGDSCHFELL